MDSLRKTLPPTNALVAFEAAARHVNFTRAAEELSVSQVAISKQIQTLERDLGVLLFDRKPRNLNLTQEGRKFYQAVTVSLRHMAQVAEELRQVPGEARLVIATTMAFASYWLMPRLSRFRTQYPDIDVVVLASDPYFGDVSNAPHVSIRFHRPAPPGDDVRLLFSEEIFPVCSPEFLDRHQMAEQADLLSVPLLHLNEPRHEPMSWPVWFEHFAIEAPPNLAGPQFPNFNEVMFAAESGQGLSLGWRHLCDDALAAGRLVRPLTQALHTQWGYYLMLPARHQRSDQAQAFAEWIELEASRSLSG
jgi:LysR family glycine cleavage system transcriptional activator